MAPKRRRLAAYAVCVSPDGILLTQLWDHDPSAGMWTLPGGGMDFGEHPEQTVLRELHEEAGLAGTVRALLDVRSRVYPAREHHGRRLGDLHALQFIYAVDASGRPQVIEVNGSTVDVAWVPLGQVDELPLVDLARHAVDLIR